MASGSLHAEAESTSLLRQLDEIATGESIHRIANLKTHYLAALSLHCELRDRDSQSLLREAEAAIRAFIAQSRLRGVMA